ncbi:formate dehydrogenase accessory sulfurtransferase FdhD [Orrella sp. JC864]|uniref:formate dehydrogenase accessory sulfurtransferase FdhD n=1 Tax=Orrella sp. JC864 TaxID=3120298 RepID=UPI0012BD5254
MATTRPAPQTDALDAPERPVHVPAPVLRVRDGRHAGADQDSLAEETPIALEYNGVSHATLLATPADLEDFALGFSLTEGIVESAGDVRDLALRVEPQGIVVELEIASACFARLKDRRRAMAGRTGCGLCGVETLSEVVRPLRPVPQGPAVRLSAILAVQRQMRERQSLHERTGATHAAAWADAQGRLASVREDVGRHNALDKLVGALARAGRDPRQGIVVVSSRASFEMVQKTAYTGAAVLAAVSAPTALAARLAHEAGLALLGFMRGQDCTVYAGAGRILIDPIPDPATD